MSVLSAALLLHLLVLSRTKCCLSMEHNKTQDIKHINDISSVPCTFFSSKQIAI